ncbi:MAG: hypothetical protein NVSMB48_00150 [Marmoricola sp.]
MAQGSASRALRQLALAEARKRPMRVLVTLGTIALGAGALSAALSLGASVQKAVDHGFGVELRNQDLIIHSDIPTGGDAAAASVGSPSNAIPEWAVRHIAAMPETASVGTSTRATAVAQVGSVTLGVNLESLSTQPRFVWQGWLTGRPPQTSNEIGLSQPTLNSLHIRYGDWVAVGLPAVGTTAFRVVGVVDTKGSMDRVNSAYGIVTSAVAQRFSGVDGPNTIAVEAKSATLVNALRDRINREAPVGLPVTTKEILDADRSVKGSAIGALGALVAALAGVSCLVAGLTAATTAAASLASRRRTWALARCIGASKRHVATLVTTEALVLGILGSVIGVSGGLVMSFAALPLVGLIPGLPPLGASTFSVTPLGVILPVALAVALAIGGAVVPSILAARIPPSAALSASQTGPSRPSLVHLAAGCVTFALGSTLAWRGSGNGSLSTSSLGLLLLLASAGALLSPVMAWTAKAGVRFATRVPIRLGFLDVVRRPRAASIEAVAVSLAVGMIALSWVALSSIQASTSARLSASPMPDLVVGDVGSSTFLSTATAQDLAAVNGIANAQFIPFGSKISIIGTSGGSKVVYANGTATADARAIATVLPEGFPIEQLRNDTVYLPKSPFPPFPTGALVRVVGPDGTLQGMRVTYLKDLQVPSMISRASMATVSKHTDIELAWLKLKSAVDRAQVVDHVTAIALNANEPVVGPTILDIKLANALSAARAAAVAILSIAVLVAVIGAAATAALSITERAREHATLRALGLERRSLGKLLATRIVFIGTVASGIGVVGGGIAGLVVARLIIVAIKLAPVAAWPVLPVAVIVGATVLAVRTAALIPMERASYIPPSRALAQG